MAVVSDMGYPAIAARCLLFLVFAVSASSKVRSRPAFDEFAESLRRLKIVPRRLAWSTAALVACGEICTVVLLAIPTTAGIGLAAATGLLTVFAAGTTVAVIRRARVPCRCFGPSARPLGVVHVIRNVVLAAAGGLGMAIGRGQDLAPAGIAVTVAASVVCTLVVVRFDDIVDLFAG